ncbi:MAG: hypothetical protein CMF31_07515 [Kordiimonas sp.]|nr:hypothetical protein [Kordiimonas sp.]|tara:strand:+ start:774 stop:1010 length:237 start_codon:yes stop_codon:yes gene_type:complete
MTHIHHTLIEEFPEAVDKLHELKVSNNHFIKLSNDYNAVNEEINKLEAGLEASSDEYAETLKKKRLTLKDEIAHLLRS